MNGAEIFVEVPHEEYCQIGTDGVRRFTRCYEHECGICRTESFLATSLTSGVNRYDVGFPCCGYGHYLTAPVKSAAQELSDRMDVCVVSGKEWGEWEDCLYPHLIRQTSTNMFPIIAHQGAYGRDYVDVFGTIKKLGKPYRCPQCNTTGDISRADDGSWEPKYISWEHIGEKYICGDCVKTYKPICIRCSQQLVAGWTIKYGMCYECILVTESEKRQAAREKRQAEKRAEKLKIKIANKTRRDMERFLLDARETFLALENPQCPQPLSAQKAHKPFRKPKLTPSFLD